MRMSAWSPPHLPRGAKRGSEQRQESLPEFDLLLGGHGEFSLHCHVHTAPAPNQEHSRGPRAPRSSGAGGRKV